jgi:LL-diaminopimelate aminotransferase
MKLSKRLNHFSEYIFSSLARERILVEQKTGRKVLDLSIGTPDFPPSKIYIYKLAEFIHGEQSHLYPGYGAIPEFSYGLCSWYQTRFGVDLKNEELLPLLGGKDGINHVAMALLDEGDEALIPDPGYPGFSGSVLLIGGKPIYYSLPIQDNEAINLNDLDKKISKRTKFIYVNFPSNPTGKVTTLDELKQIVDFVKKHGIALVYDNAYSEITFDGFIAPSILQIPGAKDMAVEIGSFSKSLSFAGYRMGWIAGNKDIINAVSKIKSQVDSGMSLPLQKLGAYALLNPDDKWKHGMLTSYEKKRNTLINKLKKLGLSCNLSKGSLYLWVKIPDDEIDSESFTHKLLNEKQILVAPGTAFGENGKHYIRISISSNIENIDKYF